MRFENKNILGKRVLHFDEKEVTITAHHYLVGKRVRRFRLDEINHRFEYQSTNVTASGCFFLMLLCLGVLWVMPFGGWIPLAVIFVIVLLFFVLPNRFTHEQIILIQTTEAPITFSIHGKNRDYGVAFTKALIQASKNYLTQKYGYVDPDISAKRQFENYRWLFQHEIISEKKMEELKFSLKEKIKNHKSSS